MAKINRVKETMVALQALGLNVETGVSDYITMKDIEEMSGLRQVSNGSRIIREDMHPFSCFKIERVTGEDGRSLQSIKFNGFRDVEYQRDVLAEGISKANGEITAQQIKISKNIKELEALSEIKTNEPLFNKESLGLYIV